MHVLYADDDRTSGGQHNIRCNQKQDGGTNRLVANLVYLASHSAQLVLTSVETLTQEFFCLLEYKSVES
jgi:hypothetical protein